MRIDGARPAEMAQEPQPSAIKAHGLYKKWGLTESEYACIVDQMGRLPNYTETGLFAAMWSEHCSYKKSKPVLRTFWSQNERVLQGPGEGAGILDIGDGQAVVFKAESHNHPSAVEPYEGAATGVGGILRDIFSMGAQPIAILDSLRFGELSQPATRRLVDGVIAGIAGYGNAIGIPTVGGEIAFDDAYQGNPLVNVMAVGVLDQSTMQVGKAEGVGNEILYVGAKTGRDGIHGATFASAEFDSAQDQDRSAVQVGDPFLEKLVMDTTIRVIREQGDKIVGVQDMGAAGLVSSSAEMASKAGRGVELNLDAVPQRESHMTPYELMLSESQERMLLVVKKGQADKIASYYTQAGLAATVIGQVRADQRYRLRFKGQIVADVAVDFLTTPPEPKMDQLPPARLQRRTDQQFQPALTDINATFLDLLGQSSLASKASLYRHFDSSVRTDTVIKPGGDAALVRVAGTKKGLAMTTDINGRYTYLDPLEGGKRAVAEAASNIVVTGAQPIGITDCLNFGNPDDPTIYYELAQAVAGINQMAKRLNTPIISGNVSLYNETDGSAIYPTPMVGMVGLLPDLSKAVTVSAKAAGDLVYLLGKVRDDFNGSALQKLLVGKPSGALRPLVEEEILHRQLIVRQAIAKGLLASAHDVADGGLALALAETVFDTTFGLTVTLEQPASWYFAESPSLFVVTVAPNQQAAFEALAGDEAQLIGKVTARPTLRFKGLEQTIQVERSQAQTQYKEALAWQLK